MNLKKLDGNRQVTVNHLRFSQAGDGVQQHAHSWKRVLSSVSSVDSPQCFRREPAQVEPDYRGGSEAVSLDSAFGVTDRATMRPDSSGVVRQ